MEGALRILHLEDNRNDADLVAATIAAEKISCDIRVVATPDEYRVSLDQGGFDLILSDFNLPSFDGLSALSLAQAKCPGTPFLFVSATIGEDRAIDLVKHGATDYVLKDRLVRLVPALRRALSESEERMKRKEAEDRLREKEEQLIHAQKMESLGTLAGGIAHDFNNVLGIILGYLNLMGEGQMDPDTHARSVESMTAAANRGAALIKQLLSFARRTEVLYEPVDLNSIVKEVVEMCSQTFPRKIVFDTRLDDTLPGILADQNQIHQALLNLSVNARDAMPAGGTLTFTTERKKREDIAALSPEAQFAEYVRIGVADTGTGMDQATRDRIFEPFFTTKGVGKGTGLGLPMVFGAAKGHHGFIDVGSVVGRGTTFSLFLPVPRPGSLTLDEPKDAVEKLPGGKETILVAEDEEALVELLRVILESEGYHVLIAKDGKEATEVFQKHAAEIDLVFTDLGLPHYNGWEAFKIMKNVKPSIIAVVASGYCDPRLKSEMLKYGVKDILDKPYLSNQILKSVRSVLDGAKPHPVS